METLNTLYDAYVTENTYQVVTAGQGKQNIKNLKSSYETMFEIATKLFLFTDNITTLEDQINAAAEEYAEKLQDPNEQGYAYNYGMNLEESK